MSDTKKPIVLVILDGFGYREGSSFNAIAQADTPHLDSWFAQYPHTLLQASGKAVGLLEGFIGNSEVGHETIGTGRTTTQPVTIIHEALKRGQLKSHTKLTSALQQLADTGHNLHLIGLLSDAGVHSHQELLYALLDLALTYNIPHIYIHPILDGRDVPPQSAQQYLNQLSVYAYPGSQARQATPNRDTYIKDKSNISIGSIHGRYYAMDRDRNWDRTQKSAHCLTHKQRPRFTDWQQLLDYWYQQNVTDEFIPPTSLDAESSIQPDDGIIFFNFRPDRARQLTELLLKDKIDSSFFITPFSYDDNLKTTPLFTQEPIKYTLMDVLHEEHKRTFAIAETEKYAHITYFFNARREEPYANETLVLIPSIKMQSYAGRPEMSARKITQAVLNDLKTDPKDFYLINYANADMVGHSGNMQATVKAVECLDKQLVLLYEQIVEQMNGTLIITADHGKAEDMFDITSNQPKTAHTNNPVPFLVINQRLKQHKEQLQLKTLADIASYILDLMRLPIPKEMKRY